MDFIADILTAVWHRDHKGKSRNFAESRKFPYSSKLHVSVTHFSNCCNTLFCTYLAVFYKSTAPKKIIIVNLVQMCENFGLHLKYP